MARAYDRTHYSERRRLALYSALLLAGFEIPKGTHPAEKSKNS